MTGQVGGAATVSKLDAIIAICDNDRGMKAVVFTTAASRQWIKLTASIRGRIVPKLQTYASTGTGDVKRLKGQGGCRLRVGDYRVIFFEDAQTITVAAVGHRRDIYD